MEAALSIAASIHIIGCYHRQRSAYVCMDVCYYVCMPVCMYSYTDRVKPPRGGRPQRRLKQGPKTSQGIPSLDPSKGFRPRGSPQGNAPKGIPPGDPPRDRTWKVAQLEGFAIRRFRNERFRNWQVSQLEGFAFGRLHNWKVSHLEGF